jgi:hypothetical protein
MGIDQTVLQKLRLLPPDDQRKVADFVESLAAARPQRPRKDPYGMFAHLNIHISAEDIDEARREAWANFPREFPLPDEENDDRRDG